MKLDHLIEENIAKPIRTWASTLHDPYYLQNMLNYLVDNQKTFNGFVDGLVDVYVNTFGKYSADKIVEHRALLTLKRLLEENVEEKHSKSGHSKSKNPFGETYPDVFNLLNKFVSFVLAGMEEYPDQYEKEINDTTSKSVTYLSNVHDAVFQAANKNQYLKVSDYFRGKGYENKEDNFSGGESESESESETDTDTERNDDEADYSDVCLDSDELDSDKERTDEERTVDQENNQQDNTAISKPSESLMNKEFRSLSSVQKGLVIAVAFLMLICPPLLFAHVVSIAMSQKIQKIHRMKKTNVGRNTTLPTSTTRGQVKLFKEVADGKSRQTRHKPGQASSEIPRPKGLRNEA